MWHTPLGDRVLTGDEAALLKAALTGVVEGIKDESSGFLDQWDYGIPLFDDLPVSQRLLLLERVATHLLTETPESMPLTAVNEATVAVLFQHVRYEIEHEMDDTPQVRHWRKLALVAYQTRDDGMAAEDSDDEWIPSSANVADWQQWDELVETLADGILWDRDYEMESVFLDAPPGIGAVLKQFLSIAPEYFSEPASDVTSDDGIEQLLRRLDVLVHDDASA